MRTRLGRAAVVTIAMGISAAAVSANTVTVYSNNAAPGDSFTNPGTGPDMSQAVGASGWLYNNVRNQGVVGINTAYARSGNASVFFQGTVGPSDPSGKTSKADVEMYNLSGMGQLKDVTALSYDWLRDSTTPSGSTSTANSWYHPSLRLYISDGTHSGYLVFERAYNQGTVAVPTDAWQTDDVVGSDYKMWTTGSLPGAFADYNTTLSQWQDTSKLGNYTVYGISSGIGSGWGGFTGAVDNITLGFGGNSTTYNFETAAVVPLPAAAWTGMSLLGGMGSFGLLRKRRQSAAEA